MPSTITKGVRVTAEAMFQPAYSKPFSNEFLFAYRITIENLGIFPVQLLRRHWFIFDGMGIYREVDGEGVTGEQPIILPDAAYQYVSACPMRSEIGQMHGFFTMQAEDETTFEAQIPLFSLITPAKCN
jgi:ApaG protein